MHVRLDPRAVKMTGLSDFNMTIVIQEQPTCTVYKMCLVTGVMSVFLSGCGVGGGESTKCAGYGPIHTRGDTTKTHLLFFMNTSGVISHNAPILVFIHSTICAH